LTFKGKKNLEINPAVKIKVAGHLSKIDYPYITHTFENF